MSTVDMPPNAQSVGGGKKKNKKDKTVSNTTVSSVQPAEQQQVQPQPKPKETKTQEVKKLGKKETHGSVKSSCDSLVDTNSDNDSSSQSSQTISLKQEEESCEVEKIEKVIEKTTESLKKKLVVTDNTTGEPPQPPPRKKSQQKAAAAVAAGSASPSSPATPSSTSKKTPVTMPSPVGKVAKEEITTRSRQSSLSYARGQVVRPTEPPSSSIVGTVAELVQDVMPKSQTQVPNTPVIEKAEWVQLSSVEKAGNPRERLDVLFVGLHRGYQIWTFNANGDCEEVLSQRQGPIRACKVLPNNIRTGKLKDPFAAKRPLMAVVDASSHIPDRQYCSVQILSLVDGSLVHRLAFDEPITALNVSDQYISVSFVNRVFVYESLTFSEVRQVYTAAPCDNCPPTVAIGGQLLAYADQKLCTDLQSAGGLAAEVEASNNDNYADQVMNAVNMFSRTIKSLGESVGATATGNMSSKSNVVQGIISVIDLTEVAEQPSDGMKCHWVAHVDPVSFVTFSPDQRLVVTADSTATVYNVFLLLPHSATPTLASVQHLYKLNRGNTPAKVNSMSFSIDSRFLSVCTNHGTCHIFAISPFGGKPDQRTHGDQFVNKESVFQRSAGLSDEAEVTALIGPSKQRAMSGTCSYTKAHPIAGLNKALEKCNTNSRIGPFPPPLCLNAIKKIKDQRYSADNLTAWATDITNLPLSAGSSTTSISPSTAARRRLEVSRMSVSFSTRPSKSRSSALTPPPLTLLVARTEPNAGAVVCEYELVPFRSEASRSTDPVKLTSTATALWNLTRTKNNTDMTLPMPVGSPLMNMATVAPRKENRRPGEEMWTPHVETRTYLIPHRNLWLGPQFEFYELKEEDSPLLMSPHENRSSSSSFKSIPVVVGGGGLPISFNSIVPSDATRIECGSYNSINSYTVPNNQDSQADISIKMKIADAMKDISYDSTDSPYDPDAIEEFYDTHSPSLPRRGSSKSSSTNSKKAPTIAQPAKYSSKETGYVDDLDAFEMEDEDDM